MNVSERANQQHRGLGEEAVVDEQMAINVGRGDTVCEFERVAAPNDAGNSRGRNGARWGEAAQLVGVVCRICGVARARVGGDAAVGF